MTFFALLAIIIVLLIDLVAIPYILIAVLGAFGVDISYLIALGIIFLVNVLFTMFKSSNNK